MKPLVLLITVLAFLLSACQGETTHSVVASTAPNPSGGVSVPKKIQRAGLINEVRAYVRVDGGGPVLMTQVGLNFELVIDGLTDGTQYQITIEFVHPLPNAGNVLIATQEKTITVSDSSAALVFGDNYIYTDDDNDGESNLDEITNGTYGLVDSNLPDLTFNTPQGWAAAVVVRNDSGCTATNCLADGVFSSEDTLYFNRGFLNQGLANSTSFSYQIFIDDALVQTYTNNSALNAGQPDITSNIALGSSYAVGEHNIRLVIDSTNSVEESDESNNEYTASFTVGATTQALSDIAPYTPMGWGGPLIIENRLGCSNASCINSTQLNETDTLYVSFAYGNFGNANSEAFSYQIFINDTEVSSSTIVQGLAAGTQPMVLSVNLGNYPTAEHTLRFVLDSGDDVLESNELNNEYSTTFTVSASTLNARAELHGPVVGASVEVYSVATLADGPIYNTTTQDDLTDFSAAGHFVMPEALFVDDQFYVVKINGGKDVDTDEDGFRDVSPTAIAGNFHTLLTGAEIKKGEWSVNPLSEIAYQQTKYMLSARYDNDSVLAKLNQSANRQLNADLSGDGFIDSTDLYFFSSRLNRLQWKARQAASLDDVMSAIYSAADVFTLSEKFDSDIVSVMDTDFAMGIALRDNYAYVINQSSGLTVVDYSNPVNPVALNTVDVLNFGSSYDVALGGNYVYVANFTNGLTVLDVVNPASPSVLNTVPTPGSWMWSLASWGGYIYLAETCDGLTVMDVANPDNPVVLASLDIPGCAYDVVVSGNYAYMAGSRGLSVIDITRPSNPVLMDTVATLGSAQGIALNGLYAYVVDDWYGLSVVDIANPALLTIVNTVPLAGKGNKLNLSGDYLYVASDYAGVAVLDISLPSAPKLLGNMASPGEAEDVAVKDGYAYVANRSNGVLVLGIPDFIYPELSSSLPVTGDASDVALAGSYVYISGGDRFTVMDMNNPSSPMEVGSVATPGDASKFSLSGNYAYVADGYKKITVIDISNPNTPTVVSTIETVSTAKDVAVSENYAYVADSSAGLTVIDISVPMNPVVIHTFDTAGVASAVKFVGNYAYVADGRTGISVIDISNPAALSLVGSLDTPGNAVGIELSGNYAYIADDGSGLSIVDISLPTDPILIATVDTPGWANDVTIDGNYAYVSDSWAGMVAVDISSPTTPKILGIVETPGSVTGVAVSGAYLYVADEFADLTILQAPQIPLNSLP